MPFFGIWVKTYLFQSCGYCWVFQMFSHIECSTFTASSFRIWINASGIPLPPLALFIVMLSKATWLHIPGCLALGQWSHHHDYLGREDLFVQFFCVFLPPLLNIFSSARSLPFLSFAWNVPLVSLIFLKRSLVVSILLFSSISLHWSLKKAFLNLSLLFFRTLHSDGYIFPFLLWFLLLFFSQLFVRHPQTVILLVWISFSWEWSFSLYPVQCHEPLSIGSSGTLSIRSSPLNLFLTFTV